MCGGRRIASNLRSEVVSDGLFASKPAPTLDLWRSQIPCGSGLAREGDQPANSFMRLSTAFKPLLRDGDNCRDSPS
ncbi:hypothetical protein C3E97_017705 [Pseudomonas sp. MWU12-2115]|nr:hypothetical protein C3E97_017705 [Pseudomonas sp. MWU12-2115]